MIIGACRVMRQGDDIARPVHTAAERAIRRIMRQGDDIARRSASCHMQQGWLIRTRPLSSRQFPAAHCNHANTPQPDGVSFHAMRHAVSIFPFRISEKSRRIILPGETFRQPAACSFVSAHGGNQKPGRGKPKLSVGVSS
jgi:hypothetical protein